MNQPFYFDESVSRSSRYDPENNAILRGLFPGARDIRKEPNPGRDDKGIDHVVALAGGGELRVDIKRRLEPVRHTWSRRDDPVLQIEPWSVIPPVYGYKWDESSRRLNIGKAGWALDGGSKSDYVCWVWHQDDDAEPVLLPYRPLRAATLLLGQQWSIDHACRAQPNQRSRHGGGKWSSRCLFVPLSVVRPAVESGVDDLVAEMLRACGRRAVRSETDFCFICGHPLPNYATEHVHPWHCQHPKIWNPYPDEAMAELRRRSPFPDVARWSW